MIKNSELKTILTKLRSVIVSMFDQEPISINLTESGDFDVVLETDGTDDFGTEMIKIVQVRLRDIDLQETFVLPENDLAASQAVMCITPGQYMIVRVLDHIEVPRTAGNSMIDSLTKLIERNDSLMRNSNLKEHTI